MKAGFGYRTIMQSPVDVSVSDHKRGIRPGVNLWRAAPVAIDRLGIAEWQR
jgi:hypothetical protein